MTNQNTPHVIACIPYYKCRPYISRAVDSLLAQTHKNLTVAVLNDGDMQTPPWPMLCDINDPRLVRFDLAKNRGPYFALQVLLNVTTAPYLLIQDADDWSHPERVARLLAAIENDQSDLAISSQPQFRMREDGACVEVEYRWHRFRDATDDPKTPFLLDRNVTRHFRYRIPHAGLIGTKTLKDLGGYYGGFRIATDVLLTNTILMVGKVSHVPLPLYHRFIRPESLTHSAETGNKSAYAAKVKAQMADLYAACYKNYHDFITGKIAAETLVNAIHTIRTLNIGNEDKQALKSEAHRLIAQYPKL